MTNEYVFLITPLYPSKGDVGLNMKIIIKAQSERQAISRLNRYMDVTILGKADPASYAKIII
jgi:hypothetical protein